MSIYPYYFTWNHQPSADIFPVVAAERDEFVLDDGRRIYDFISTSFQANFGHRHPLIVDAIRKQLDQMIVTSPKASFELKHSVSQRLIDLLALPDGKIFYTVSGSESVENALKMARQVTGRTKILARRKSYHGASLGALSVTGDWRNAPHFTIDAETVRIPEPEDDPELVRTRQIVRDAQPSSIAAIILETVSGTNGVAIPQQTWFDQIQALCREHDILLILDEVLCGFARTGPDFAFQSYGLMPDLVCMSKGITGGYIPFGAVWTGPRIVEFYASHKMACGLTSYAHPLGLAALQGVLNVMQDAAFRANKLELETLFGKWMVEIAAQPFVRQVRHRGLIAAIDFLDRPAPTWEACFERGLHVYGNDATSILAPPLISTPDRLATVLADFSSVL